MAERREYIGQTEGEREDEPGAADDFEVQDEGATDERGGVEEE
jgi:hypothetical protein